jgi:hypothetical protein
MWGISGKVILGVSLAIDVPAYEPTLGILCSWPVMEEIVCVEDKVDSIMFWFSGPRQAGDFVAHWCSHAHSLCHLLLKVLQPLSQYIAILQDDMLSVQDWHNARHMASQGLDTYSICPNCSGTDLHVLSTSAQRFGNPNRTIRFFCSQCKTLHTQCRLLPSAPYLLWFSSHCAKFQQDPPPLLSRPIDFETVEKYTHSQKNNKKPGANGISREVSKYSPRPFIVLYWRAFNAFARGDKQSICEHEWQGALVTSLAKKLAALLVTESYGLLAR